MLRSTLFFFFSRMVRDHGEESCRRLLLPGGFANSGDGHGWGPRIALECNLQAYFTQTPPLDRPTLVHRIRVCGCELLLSCVGVLLRLNFWVFSGNCRPCLRVVQLPEWTTGPTSQETPTTLPAGNEGSQAYSVVPCLQPGSTDHLGRS